MTRVKPASVPQCWRAISRAAAVHRLCPHETADRVARPDVTGDGLLERQLALSLSQPLAHRAHRPVQRGGRFSAKAAGPSLASSLENTSVEMADSIRYASFMSTARPRSTLSLVLRTANGPLAVMRCAYSQRPCPAARRSGRRR